MVMHMIHYLDLITDRYEDQKPFKLNLSSLDDVNNCHHYRKEAYLQFNAMNGSRSRKHNRNGDDQRIIPNGNGSVRNVGHTVEKESGSSENIFLFYPNIIGMYLRTE